MLPKFSRVVESLRDDGLGATLRISLISLYEKWWERRLGVETDKFVRVKELGFEDETYHNYLPTSYWDLRHLMKRIGLKAHQDVFLDMGSGKGRVVIMAAMYAFKRVIGVEVAPALAEVARANVQAVRHKLKTPTVEIVTHDATTYPIEPDVNMFFFYNPFHGTILTKVFDNIHRSLQANPRDITVIYRNPMQWEAVVTGLGWLEKTDEFGGMHRHVIFKPRAQA